MIAGSISVLVLGAVLSALILLLKSSYAVGNYVEMSDQTRRCIELLGRDIRNATELVSMADEKMVIRRKQYDQGAGTVTIETVTYAVEAVDEKGNPLDGEFVFVRESLAEGKDVLLTGLREGELIFRYFDSGDNDVLATGGSTQTVKKIDFQISLVRNVSLTEQTSEQRSVRFVLRSREPPV